MLPNSWWLALFLSNHSRSWLAETMCNHFSYGTHFLDEIIKNGMARINNMQAKFYLARIFLLQPLWAWLKIN